MKEEQNNLFVKILAVILLFACAGCFVLSRFITETYFVLLSILALIVIVVAEKVKYGFAATAAIAIITLEFFRIIPLPYNYLFSHGLTMGPAILLTLLAAAGYVVVVISIIFAIFKSTEKL